MKLFNIFLYFSVPLFFCTQCKKNNLDIINPNSITLIGASIGTYELSLLDSTKNTQIPINNSILLRFSSSLDSIKITTAISLEDTKANKISLSFSFLDNNKTISCIPKGQSLNNNTSYKLNIESASLGKDKEYFTKTSLFFTTQKINLSILSLSFDEKQQNLPERIINTSLLPTIKIEFNKPLLPEKIVPQNFQIASSTAITPTITLEKNNTILNIIPTTLTQNTRYSFWISDKITGQNGESFPSYSVYFYTAPDTLYEKTMTDEELLTLVQKQTFKYFYDYAHPSSGMARERLGSEDIVTSGGSGFGVMAFIVAMERNFITRKEGLAHIEKILTFLEKADKFHGAWSHWINGSTGKVVSFSQKDDGGDLVETSYMAQGLITLRQYLHSKDSYESSLQKRINNLLNNIEWNWYTQNNENVLYWHWSPNYGWEMNFKITGYNEALITYIMAACSPTYPINPEVYHQGWAKKRIHKNGKNFYGITLPLGFDYGGPLFFSHYSFLGLDPRNLSDRYANYWEQNTAHTLINRLYCIVNPKKNAGYNTYSWGLTASDNQNGYSAHDPTNDLGVITPTAALSSFPYTPKYSMDALHFFYYKMENRIWKEYGFVDAFNTNENWYASSFLAIDQGPIIVMIENYRTALLWNLFMSAPEVKQGLTRLDFKIK